MAIGKIVGKLVGKATKKTKKPKAAPKPKAEETFESEMRALRSKAMTDSARKAETDRIAKKYKKAAPAKKKTKKAKKLSPDKARQDLAVVGKKAQEMMTALRAKQDKLAKMIRDGAAPDAIERQRAAIKGMKERMGSVLKAQVKLRKAKPIPKGNRKKAARPAPRQKAPAEVRPIPAGLIAAAREAKGPTFTYKGKKYSKAIILKGAKK